MGRPRHRDKYAHLRPKAGDRSHYRSDGVPKRQLSKESADLIILRRQEEGLEDMHSYQCPVCEQWHVGRFPLAKTGADV